MGNANPMGFAASSAAIRTTAISALIGQAANAPGARVASAAAAGPSTSAPTSVFIGLVTLGAILAYAYRRIL